MRKIMKSVIVLSTAAAVIVACRGSMTPSPAPAQQVPDTAAAIQRFNDSVMQAQLTRLGARQADSAVRVFTNLQLPTLRTTSARTFLSIMNGGYAKALGVTCAHCHDLQDFGSDAKRPKLAAREMALMHRTINQELAKMQHIATPPTQNRAINCMTCHRGRVNPR
jgi:hypothetical protein